MLGIISDTHGNLVALKAILADANKLGARAHPTLHLQNTLPYLSKMAKLIFLLGEWFIA